MKNIKYMKYKNKYLVLYLLMAFGAIWGVGICYTIFADFFVPITGELTLMHPVTIIALYSPSIAGLIIYFLGGGKEALKAILLKVIPRKKDLFWFPILLGVSILFAALMHYGSLFFGIEVPVITRTVPQMIVKGFLNFFQEAGLIGGVFGWIGFVLPFLQSKFKNNVTSGLLTGFLFGLWVLPGYLISSMGTTTDYFYYVTQLMAFVLFQSYIFNATKGCLGFFLFSFWLAATGSQIELYYFNPQVQIMQITFFAIAAVVLHVTFKKKNIDQSLQTFPEFIQGETERLLKADSISHVSQ
ncbi:MAG: hypothetical protein KAX49_04240 [Halanaerobiales bacterium]|nr:hypothetical protein [Halanaerobiales bacterium]